MARGAGSRRGTSAGRTATFVLLSPGVLWQTFPFRDGGGARFATSFGSQINASPEQEGGYTASRATIFLGNVVRAPHARARTSHWSMGGYKSNTGACLRVCVIHARRCVTDCPLPSPVMQRPNTGAYCLRLRVCVIHTKAVPALARWDGRGGVAGSGGRPRVCLFVSQEHSQGVRS